MSDSRHATLLTGGSGFLGALTAAVLLAEERRRLVVPLRPTASSADCLARIGRAIRALGVPPRDVGLVMHDLTIAELPPPDRLADLDDLVASARVDEIVHCAGCVDYFDWRRLQAANVDLTAGLAGASRRWRARRFVYLSSAFCGGYRRDVAPERLHPDPAAADEPTDYTRTKRMAERLIAESGVPFLIVRPSVVIGDSRTGEYGGRNYGLYQLWRAFEGLLTREHWPAWHVVAPPTPVNLVHSDMFQSAFAGFYRGLPANAIAHLVSDTATCPTLRELFLLWSTEVSCPTELHCYDEVDEVPLAAIPARQRRFLEFAAKNLEIASRLWRFDTGALDRLRLAGLRCADATIDTVARCQQQYVRRSAKIQAHLGEHRDRRGTRPRLVDHGRRPLRCEVASP